MKKKHLALAVSLALPLLASQSVQAYDKYYYCNTGSVTSGTCWSSSAYGFAYTPVPTSGDTAYYGYSSGSWQTATLGTADSAYSSEIWLGYSGSGTFIQTGGSNSITYNLNLGYKAGSAGSYDMQAGTLTIAREYIGIDGSGLFTQSGGTHTVSNQLYISNRTGAGTYNLSGGTLASDTEVIGYITGMGTFKQTGGIHTVSSSLTIANSSANQSSYTLSGTGSLSAASENIGASGTFTQTGGTNAVTGALTLAQSGSSNGTYDLKGGTLTVGTIGYSSRSGTVNIDGGALNVTGSTINVNYFRVGNAAYTNGSFTLASGKTLAANNEVIGNAGTGTFTQNGGTHSSSTLTLGANGGSTGTFNLNGGTLSVSSIANGAGTGVFNLNGGTLTLAGVSMNVDTFNLGHAAGSNGSFVLAASRTLTAANVTVGVSGIGNFTQSGGTHTLSNALTLGASSGSSGTYTLNGGTLSALYIANGAGTGTLNINGGTLSVFGGNGTIDVDTLVVGASAAGTHTQTGGSVTAAHETIGASAAGTFTQSGGGHTVISTLTLGADSGSTGTYNLNGGNLGVGAIGNGAGTGTFNLNSGSLTLNGASIDVDTFNLGMSANANSGFTLVTGKTLAANNETIGGSGYGTFTQNGGVHTVANALTLGSNAGSFSTFNLNGGNLSVGSIVNGTGSGMLNLNGGTLNLTGSTIDVDNFRIGQAVGSNGSFTLASGKNLTAAYETIGNAGTGTGTGTGSFTQAGGTHTVAYKLTVGASGQMNLSGGNMTAGNVTSAGALNLSGGTLTGDISTSGNMNVSNTVTHTGNLTQTAGVTTVNGSLNTGTLTLQGGVLKGSGSINGTVLNSAGTLSAGNSPGRLTINGDYTQSAAATFDAEVGGLIAGSQHDVLNVSGNAYLDGTLNVSLVDLGSGLFASHAGDYFDILGAEHLYGSFGRLTFAALDDPALSWHVDYLTDAYGTTDVVRLSVQAVPEADTWAMLLAGLGLVGAVTRRRRG